MKVARLFRVRSEPKSLFQVATLVNQFEDYIGVSK